MAVVIMAVVGVGVETVPRRETQELLRLAQLRPLGMLRRVAPASSARHTGRARRRRRSSDPDHARELTTPREVWFALRYVLLNARHHCLESGIVLPPGWIDDRSTAVTFDRWRVPPQRPERRADFGTEPARSWLLREGWRRYGLLDLDDVPGPSRARDGDAIVWLATAA